MAIGEPALRQTPITRLAWKFSRNLATTEDSQELMAADRRAEIATAMRQDSGFARLVRAYSDELPSLGPATASARFLFVIDQFEELFHPNNRHNLDAKALVEAVIDHFFNPHERCYVVLTMRSEYLTDCAGYLELPDVLNKSCFFVRRLDRAEMRDAIVQPTRYVLRLLQRQLSREGPGLPHNTTFDESVLERVLEDARKISDDPDHLPLLQHLLVRMWEAACAREFVREGVPERITWDDLRRAATGAPTPATSGINAPGAQDEIDDATNVLRASLENWAEFMYLRSALPEREWLDSLLRIR